MQRTMRRFLLLVPVVVLACTVTRPAALPAPALGDQRQTVLALLVTDSTGHAQWIYRVWVDADTLRGLRHPDMARETIAIPVGTVKAVAAHHFSAGRTAGLVGGVLAAFVAAAVIVAPAPVYGVHAP